MGDKPDRLLLQLVREEKNATPGIGNRVQTRLLALRANHIDFP